MTRRESYHSKTSFGKERIARVGRPWAFKQIKQCIIKIKTFSNLHGGSTGITRFFFSLVCACSQVQRWTRQFKNLVTVRDNQIFFSFLCVRVFTSAKMGKTASKPSDNSGTVVNTVEVNEIHQAEVVNSDLFIILYIIVIMSATKLTIQLYKMWQRNLKRRYMTRAQSVDLV